MHIKFLQFDKRQERLKRYTPFIKIYSLKRSQKRKMVISTQTNVNFKFKLIKMIMNTPL